MDQECKNTQLLVIGEHCSVEWCNQLDFLPYTCQDCKGTFCFEHYQRSDHSCQAVPKSRRTIPLCPVCSLPVPARNGEDLNCAMERHILSKCPTKTQLRKNCCSFVRTNGKQCTRKTLQPIYCKSCRKQFCLTHRLESTHG